jgi:hypothetical protein
MRKIFIQEVFYVARYHNHRDARSLVDAVANLSPAARKQARIDHLNYLTSVADEAIDARRNGKKLGRWEGE